MKIIVWCFFKKITVLICTQLSHTITCALPRQLSHFNAFPHTVLEAVVFDDEVINSREIADLLPKLKSKEICVAFPKSKSSVAVYKSISKKHKLVFKHAGGTFPEFYKHVSEKWCRRTRGTYIECTVGIVRNRETYRNLLKMDQVLTVSELNLILN